MEPAARGALGRAAQRRWGPGARGRGDEPPVAAPLGRYVYEPDGAAIRAGLVGESAPGAWLLDPHVAYLSSDEPIDTPWATRFEVLDVLDYSVKALRGYVRDRGIGTLEIKKRAIDVDPAALRRELKPKGSAAATIILARTVDGTVAIIARRSNRSASGTRLD